MQVRIATRHDAKAIHAVHLAAFPESESAVVAKLAVDLLLEETTPPILSLVAEEEGMVVGHGAFSPVTIEGTRVVPGYILAPLAVGPDHQRCGIGTELIEAGIARLSEMDQNILLVYGDPALYGRFGFRADVAGCYKPPYPLKHPFGWQGLLLEESLAPTSPVSITCVSSLNDPDLW